MTNKHFVLSGIAGVVGFLSLLTAPSAVQAANACVTIVNNGYIVGAGGTGGYGTSSGTNGGPALVVQSPVSILNNGTLRGGGGGGGGGQTGYEPSGGQECGGGGAGHLPGMRGSDPSAFCSVALGFPAATLTQGGAGTDTGNGAVGGNGGNLGAPGQNGYGDGCGIAFTTPCGLGGVAGTDIIGTSYVTWGGSASGDIQLTVSSNTANYNLYNAAVAAGWTAGRSVVLTINSGVVIGSNATSQSALTIGSFPSTSACDVQTSGTIHVTSNVSSSWVITGPATITGSGTSQTSASQPTGTYTITWNSVSGYTTPTSQSLTLTSGGTITFNGTYSSPPLPDLTATATKVTSASITLGQTTSFSAKALNIGDGDATNVPNIFQIMNSTKTMPNVAVLDTGTVSLNAGDFAPITATTGATTFPAPGTYYVRACANIVASTWSWGVAESNTGNNCGAWKSILVSEPPAVNLQFL